jgi:hypothetical protein
VASATKPRLNKQWHEAHRMPQRATLDQRVTWHQEHLKHCACRTDLPAGIAAEIEKRKKRA